MRQSALHQAASGIALLLTVAMTACSSTAPSRREPRENTLPPTGTSTDAPRPDPSTPATSQPQPTSPTNPVPPSATPTSPPPPRPPAPTTPPPDTDRLAAIRGIHDPAIIREGDWFYCFSTGPGIRIDRSRDLATWEAVGRVFRLDVPDWAKREIPTSVVPWAPDIALVDGRYVLTYSVATFGQNRSLIGMASTPTLDPSSRDYQWRHDGKVVESFTGDDYNAIDSNIVLEPDAPGAPGRAFLSFGSYWTGIKMIALDRATLKPLPGASLTSIARRQTDGGIEAPYIVHRDGWYYCFLAFDKCCRGVESTYNVRVGRSRSIDGPYYDRDNTPLMRGGGTSVLKSSDNMIGPGHCAVFQDSGRWYITAHYYDANADGKQTLLVRELLWDHTAWPRAGQIIGGI